MVVSVFVSFYFFFYCVYALFAKLLTMRLSHVFTIFFSYVSLLFFFLSIPNPSKCSLIIHVLYVQTVGFCELCVRHLLYFFISLGLWSGWFDCFRFIVYILKAAHKQRTSQWESNEKKKRTRTNKERIFPNISNRVAHEKQLFFFGWWINECLCQSSVVCVCGRFMSGLFFIIFFFFVHFLALRFIY